MGVIDGLVAGRLHAAAERRLDKMGRPFVVAKVRATAGEGDGLIVNVIAFAEPACAALMTLDEGESVALAGSLVPKVWVDKQGVARPALDMQAHQVMMLHAIRNKGGEARAVRANGGADREGRDRAFGG